LGRRLFSGGGAGPMPTASAVVADLIDVTRLITADPEHRVPHLAFQPDRLSDERVLPIGEVETSYYLRLRVLDKPGVLADVARLLAERSISIEAMVQREPPEGENRADIVMLTHSALEKDVNAAIARIEKLRAVVGKVTKIRMEALL
jgi:homoserine dehydrogenase